MKLCDTSVLVDVDRGGIDEKVERLDDQGTHAISVVTVTELRLGVNYQHDPGTEAHREAVEGLDRLLARFEIEPVTPAIARAAADVIASLKRAGTPLHDLHDVYVAATAQTGALSVLTANVDHFERIDGVAVEDWAAF